MKTLILTFSLLLSFTAFGQEPDSIFAEVLENYVVIYDQGAHRNCGAGYQMIVSEEDNTITWLQADTGQVAFCICYFDMYVKVGPLEAGDYTAMVYFTEIVSDDTIYCGQTEFTIEDRQVSDDPQIVEQSQSDCYNYVGLPEESTAPEMVCYPNPASSYINFEINTNAASRLTINDLIGQEVKHFDLNEGKHKLHWDLKDESGNRLPPGLYFYTLQSGEKKISGKMLLKH